MSADLDELLEQVVDQLTFFAFVEALAADFAQKCGIEANSPSAPCSRGALGWENGRIDTFLGAAHARGTATIGNPDHDSEGSSTWRRFAEILYAGKYYE